ncbi:hypothetical protein SLEP1_g27171 [Rubroshorea leprosula]|uniref:ABC transporter domain-containing protein n=1 Tax=Rubroshorea leprosula TaxID=152421 RepID=A0AAV5K0A5_9ROSI|nr:hypothetical protein SLEP1_g27171 [Rubroshorea leprosula]
MGTMEIEVTTSSSNQKHGGAAGSGGGSRYHERAVYGDRGKGIYLVWEDLNVVLPNFGNKRTKRLIQELNGFTEPGRIMAIMGPSGFGKSTLLALLQNKDVMSCLDFPSINYYVLVAPGFLGKMVTNHVK